MAAFFGPRGATLVMATPPPLTRGPCDMNDQPLTIVHPLSGVQIVTVKASNAVLKTH